jgi:hypothetical protein
MIWFPVVFPVNHMHASFGTKSEVNKLALEQQHYPQIL